MAPNSPQATPVSPSRSAEDSLDLRRIVRLFRPYRGRVLMVAGLIFVSALVGLAQPFLIREAIDVALPDGNVDLLTMLVLGMVGAAIIGAALDVGQTWLSNTVGQRVMHDLRTAVYGHLQKLSLAFFTRTRSGEVQSRISNDIGGMQGVVTSTVTSFVSSLTTVIATLTAMIFLDWRLALATLAVVPFFVWLSRTVGKARRRIVTHRQRRLADMSAIVEESLSISGIVLTRTMGRAPDLVDRFAGASDQVADLEVRSAMAGRWRMSTVQIAFAAMPALVYWIAGYSSAHGGTFVTIGTLVAFTTLQTRLLMPMVTLLRLGVEIQTSLALFTRVFEYLDSEIDIAEPEHPVRSPLAAFDEVHGVGDGDRGVAGGGRRAADGVPGAGAAVDREVCPAAAGKPQDESVGGVPSGAASAVSEGPGRPRRVPALPVRFENVSFGYDPRAPRTLDGIDLDVAAGSTVAIVGHTGSGKTTLGYLAARLYDVDEGRVTIGGVDVRDLSDADRSGLVGVVAQETYLLHSSVADNLRFARPEATDEELEAAARDAQIHELIASLPDGYDTVVGERGYRFSGGEKQRLAIARAMLRNSPVLILDEATSALDTRTEFAVQQALERLAENRTTIAIAHRLSTVRDADLIVVLDQGRIVEQGAHDDLLALGGAYAALVERDRQDETLADIAA